jgi:transposase
LDTVDGVLCDRGGKLTTCQSCQRDLSDEEWELIADLVPTFSGGGRMGRPAKHAKRDIVDAVLFVAATGCQWRALPPRYPNWNTVYRYYLAWSRDGTWAQIVDRLRGQGRQRPATSQRCLRGSWTPPASKAGRPAAARAPG